MCVCACTISVGLCDVRDNNYSLVNARQNVATMQNTPILICLTANDAGQQDNDTEQKQLMMVNKKRIS